MQRQSRRQLGGARDFGANNQINNFVRNRNMVRHTYRRVGSFTYVVMTAIMVLLVGMVYVSQRSGVMDYDYKISSVEREIADLKLKKDALAVEQARLTSVTRAEQSELASQLVKPSSVAYVVE